MSFKKILEIPIFFMFIWVYLTFFAQLHSESSHTVPRKSIILLFHHKLGFKQSLITLLLTIWINYEKAGGVAGLVRPPKESYCKDHLVVKKCHSDPEEDELVTEYQ